MTLHTVHSPVSSMADMEEIINKLDAEKLDDENAQYLQTDMIHGMVAPMKSLSCKATQKQSTAPDSHRTGTLKAVQAVVLAAGLGAKLSKLFNPSTRKSFMPIATIPMLYYPLHMLQKAGFKECDVLVYSECGQAVMDMVKEYSLTMKIKLTYIDPTEDPGTKDALKHVLQRIYPETEDVVVVSSDIVSDLCVSDMLACHRSQDNGVTILTAEQDEAFNFKPPGAKQKNIPDSDALLHNNCDGCVLCSASSGDYDDEELTLIDNAMGGSQFSTMDVSDQHLYIFNRKLFTQYVLADNTACSSMASLRAEVVPHLIDMQYSYDIDQDQAYIEATNIYSESMAETMADATFSPLSSRNARTCRTYHHDKGFCVRANTMVAYWSLNRKIPKMLKEYWPESRTKKDNLSKSKVHEKAVLRDNTLLGPGCDLSERCTIIDSSLGRNCVIKPMCRITDCVIMDDVTVEQGCVLEKCVLSCTISQENCTIKNCIVASSKSLHKNATFENETMEMDQYFSA